MKVGDPVLCTQKIHGAFKKGHHGHVTRIDDDIVCIDGTCIDAALIGKHFTKVTGYLIKPAESKKWHIHMGDSQSLCNKWAMKDLSDPIIGISEIDVNKDEVCKVCYNKYLKEVE